MTKSILMGKTNEHSDLNGSKSGRFIIDQSTNRLMDNQMKSPTFRIIEFTPKNDQQNKQS